MIHKNVWAWTWYLVGALLTLAWKLVRYVRAEKLKGVKTREAVMEWFFEDSTDNTVSWVTTIGAVWTFGTLYINQKFGAWFGWVSVIPVENGIAFFFGGLMEILAPNIVKRVTSWVISKLPS